MTRVLALVLFCAGCATPMDHLAQADRWLRLGRVIDARNLYMERTRSADGRERVLAFTGAARASLRLHDRLSARRFLEKAVAPPEVAGATDEAYRRFAEFLRGEGKPDEAAEMERRAAALAATGTPRPSPDPSPSRDASGSSR